MNDKFFSKKYKVKKEIASGGMGTIYLATDTKLGRDVAIKMLHPQYSGEPAFAKRFLREAWAMAKLDHPNIIRIWSVEEEEGSHCIVMEYFPGNDLKQIIRSRGPIPITEALPLIIQIIQGLAYAHYMGIIHRDIKPANILVDQEGKVKITDFGIAAAFTESSLTMDGTVMGTPEYMAPEQARAEAVGSHTDLYSVGILMYELLTGQTPYKGIPAHSLVAKLAFEAENPSLNFPPHIPGELQDLIIRLTQKRVEDRLKDINEILSVLKTDFPLSSAQKQDDDKTEVYPPNDPSERRAGPSEKTFVKDQPILPQDKTANRLDIPSDLPPPNDDPESYNERPPRISSQTRKLIISAIGILTISVMAVLIVSQWPVEDLPPSQSIPQGEKASQFDTQDRVKTTVENIQQTSQNVQTTQKEIDKEFESLSSALQSLHGDIRNKKIPSNYSDAQQWLDKTKKEVAALVLNKGEIEKSQQFIVEKNKKVVASSIQQGEQLLLQQNLSQDQRKQINEATNNLEIFQQELESIFTNHLQITQNRLSKLEDVLQQSVQTVLARKKLPKKETTPPQSVSKAKVQLAALKAETHSLDKEIKAMVKSFEESTQNFTSELSNVQTEIKQIDISSDPNSTQKLVGLKENLRTIQQKAQKVFTQQKSRQQNLIKTVKTTAQTYQGFSQKSLDSSQKAELGRLNAILKNNENQLNAFPPDSWNRLQSLSLEIESAIMATKNMMAQNIQQQHDKAQQIEALDKRSIQLTDSIQAFRSKSFNQHQSFTTQITTYATQIDALEHLKKNEELENTTRTIQVSLDDLKNAITQYSSKYDLEFQNLGGNQAEILKDLNEMTNSALTPILKEQASQVLQTLQSNQQELEELKQLGGKKLQTDFEMTLRAFNQTKKSIKQEKDSTPPPPKGQPAHTVEALNKILDDFTAAYQNRDLLHLKLTTLMSESRTRNLNLMFQNYRTIGAHTKIISTSETQAKAKVFIDKLINQKGESITPNFIIRETTITIPKKDGKWGKIQW